jgi:hypothetical protein
MQEDYPLSMSAVSVWLIKRTDYPNTGMAEVMGIDHGGRYICMSCSSCTVRISWFASSRWVAKENEPADPLLVSLLGAVGIASAPDLTGITHEELLVCGADQVQRTLTHPLFHITQLIGRQPVSRGQMVGFELSGGIEPVAPVNLPGGPGCQEIAIENPYGIDTLAELPAREMVLAACCIGISCDASPERVLILRPFCALMNASTRFTYHRRCFSGMEAL